MVDLSTLSSDLGAFEGAVSSKLVKIEPKAIKRVLLAVDRSNQDATSIALAAALARKHQAAVDVVGAYEGPAWEEVSAYAMQVVDRLRSAPSGLRAEVVTATAPHPSQQILSAKQKTGADLIVVASPFLRDIGLLGDESLSSPIDMLLAESRVPLLIVRQPVAEVDALFTRLILPVAGEAHIPGILAGWAFALAGQGATIEVCAVADRVALAEGAGAASAGGADEQLLREENRLIGGLTAALQKAASERSVEVLVHTELGRAVQVLAEVLNAKPSIGCIDLPNDRTSVAFHRVQDLLLRARHPVLVVPER